MKRILLTLLILLITVGIVSTLTGGHPGFVLLIPLGAIFGPFMGIMYPFPMWQKITYIIVLILSGTGTMYGIKNRSKPFGQIIAVISIVVWILFGLFGLGTGT